MEDEFQPNWSTLSLHLFGIFQSSLPRTVLSLLLHTLKTPTHPSQDSAQFHLYHEIQSNGLNNLEFNVIETSISVTMPLIPNQILVQLAVLLWDKFLRFSIFQL